MTSGKSEKLADRMEATGGEHPPRDVGEVAVRGSQVANQIVYESGRMIGGVLAGLVNLYNPEAIFIGGGARKISLVLFHHPASHSHTGNRPVYQVIGNRLFRFGDDAAAHGAI